MKKILSLLFAFCLLISLFSIDTVFAQPKSNIIYDVQQINYHKTSVPAGYTGIYTKSDLDSVRNGLNGKYILMNDISFTESDFLSDGQFYNDGKGWIPIGSDSSDSFSGTFDGNGYIISGLALLINDTETDYTYAGLFGYCTGYITSLGLTGGIFHVISTGFTYVGGIAGVIDGGLIEKCFNNTSLSLKVYERGNVSGDPGIEIGDIYGVALNEFGLSSAIYTGAFTGGIAGGAKDSDILNCYNSANIVSEIDTIIDVPCIRSGGIVGIAIGLNMSNTYNIGNISALNVQNPAEAQTGGIAGQADGYDISNNCYSDTMNSGIVTGSDLCTALSLDEMKLSSSYPSFDFADIWQIDDSSGYMYPQLQMRTNIGGNVTISGNAVGGEILAADISAVTPAGAVVSYQWTRNGTAISGATNPSYTLTADDVGNNIAVNITGINAFCGSISSVSVIPTAPVLAEITLIPGSYLIRYENGASYIKGINMNNRSIGNIKQQFVNDNLIFYNIYGDSCSDNNLAVTGTRICLYNDNNEIIDEVTIIILGDITQDGLITLIDYNAITLHVKSKVRIPAGTPAYEAGNIDLGGVINLLDFSLLKQHCKGMGIINQVTGAVERS